MRAANQFADAATGVVYIHASPAAVCPHVEWALSSTLSARANLKWTPQPAMPGQLRAVTNWLGPVGTGAALASALRSWSVLRFEVTEDPSAGIDGHRWCHTPQLGLWSGAMSANGDVMVGEMRLRTLMSSGADMLAAELDSVLGTAWDEALDAYRHGGDTAEVSWLSRGSSVALTACSTATPRSPTSSRIHGRWSAPTAWWRAIVAPVRIIASDAAVFALCHCSIGLPRWPATTVKYNEAPVGYTCEMWHSTSAGVPDSASDFVRASVTAAFSAGTLDQFVAVSSVSHNAPADSSESRR